MPSTSLGLSLARDAPKGVESPLMTAYRHGLIDEPIWTLWLTKSSQTAGHPAGRITYGAVDATNCGSNVDYFDVEPYQEYDFLLPLFSVSLGNYTADATSSLLFAADLDISRFVSDPFKNPFSPFPLEKNAVLSLFLPVMRKA